MAAVVTAALVFAVTYLLIAGRRLHWMPLDRPAGALVGAVLCVALRVLTPAQALGAINGETLVLLFGLMGVGAFLADVGLLERASTAMVTWARTPARLLGLLVWGAGALAALVTNDAVCVLGAPVVVGWIKRYRLPALPFLLALATASNTGSVATLVGNPQNMLCGTLGGLVYRQYLLHLAPVAVIGLAVNHALLAWLFRRELAVARLDPNTAAAAPPGLDRRSWFTVVAGGLATGACHHHDRRRLAAVRRGKRVGRIGTITVQLRPTDQFCHWTRRGSILASRCCGVVDL